MNYRINQWFSEEPSIAGANQKTQARSTEEQSMTLQLDQHDAVVAVFVHHQDAEDAVRKLAASGLDMTHFSIVGQGFHSEEKVVGFYNVGDRIKFWGKKGAFW
ncbi:hypothetical protein, partial [Streptococcus mutans]|uniref:hypothetical protein n=1 Tax=Streptococcus mutans TaxID=1309 RepID=UPI0019344C6C